MDLTIQRSDPPPLLLLKRTFHLSGIGKLAPHLTRDNREELLRRAVHKSKRQIEELVAELRPRPQAPPMIRKLGGRRTESEAGATPALGPDRVDPPGSGLGDDDAQGRDLLVPAPPEL